MIELTADLLDWLGEAEVNLIRRAKVLLEAGRAPTDIDRVVYRHRVISVHSQIVNLSSNIYYHRTTKERDYNQRKFYLFDAGHYNEYTKSERETVASIRDDILVDLSETLLRLRVLHDYLIKIEWLLKDAANS